MYKYVACKLANKYFYHVWARWNAALATTPSTRTEGVVYEYTLDRTELTNARRSQPSLAPGEWYLLRTELKTYLQISPPKKQQ